MTTLTAAARTAAAVTLMTAAALAGCSSDDGSSVTTATTSATQVEETTAQRTTPAPATSATSSAAAPASGTGSASAGAVPTTGPALATALAAASTGQYQVRSTVTGSDPMTVTGRGSLPDKTVALHLDGDTDTAQDVEVVGTKAYTSLAGVTEGTQRILVDLADPADPLVDTVAPIVAAGDLGRVVSAVRSATKVSASGTTVTAVVPGRSLVALFGAGIDGAVPASAPLTLVLDAQGRPTTVSATLGTAKRTSAYSGWGAGAPIVAPAAADIVDSPL